MKILIATLLTFAFLQAKDNIVVKSKAEIKKLQVKKAMEDEKKYAQEQKFYNAQEYDFSGAEVNLESVKHLKELEVDDLDMDSVYD
jgi:hypothetical protein